MVDNNLEATTYIQYNPGTNPLTYFYTSLELSVHDPVQEQLEVLRIFDTDDIAELEVNSPDADELDTLFTLRDVTGSSMYTVNESEGRIVFSANTDDYIWKDNTHHTRGADIQLDILDPTIHTVIVRRKSVSAFPRMTWTVGTKITARSLNAQGEQMLNLLQELRTIELNPEVFDNRIGSSGGIVPLDANATIPLKYIPEQLGGQGVLFINLSTNTISDLANVRDDEPVNGEVLTRRANKWEPAKPFADYLDLADAPNQGVIIWDAPINPLVFDWQIRKLSMNDLGNVQNLGDPDLVTGQILYYNDPDATGDGTWEVSAVDETLTDDHVLTWNIDTSKWEARLRPDITYEVFNLGEQKMSSLNDVFYLGTEANPSRVDGDVLVWFYGGASDTGEGPGWRDKSLDTWDLNNWWYGDDDITDINDPGYSGEHEGAQLWKFYNSGDVPYWDPLLNQKDDWAGITRGSFHVGPMFSGGRNEDGSKQCDFDAANNHDVIKWKVDSVNGNHWELAPLNMNHLEDVFARHYNFVTYPNGGGPSTPPLAGDILVWWDHNDYDELDPDTGPENSSGWILKSGVDLGGSVPGDFDYFTTTHKFDSKLAEHSDLLFQQTGEGFAGVWMDMHRFSHTRVSLNSWEMYSNGGCACRVRLFKTTYGDWEDSDDWINVTRNSGTDQNSSSRVLGWAQGNPTPRSRKRITSANTWYLDDGSGNDAQIGSGSPNFYKDDLLVIELENFQENVSDGTNVLMLTLTWQIEVW
jgi:hypothetical protein